MTGLPEWAVREPDEPVQDWLLRVQVSLMVSRPRPAREVWDDATDAEADVLFATYDEREIRRRQHLCREQMRLAGLAHDTQALANLQRMDDALMRAMLARTPEHDMIGRN